jgi:hypothetical protein
MIFLACSGHVFKRNLSFVFNGLASIEGEQLFEFVPDSFGSVGVPGLGGG